MADRDMSERGIRTWICDLTQKGKSPQLRDLVVLLPVGRSGPLNTGRKVSEWGKHGYSRGQHDCALKRRVCVFLSWISA